MHHLCSINGKIDQYSESSLHISDLGILRGAGIFDFFLVRNNNPMFFDKYMLRFEKSIAGMGFEVDLDQVGIDILKLIKANDHIDSSLKVLVTGGYSEDEFTLSRPNVIIINKPFRFLPTKEHNHGGKLITTCHQREPYGVKSTNYTHAILNQKSMIREEASELLYLDHDEVRECSRSNIFIVKNGSILTPNSKILYGITRSNLIDIAQVEQKVITRDMLMDADEVFITSTTKKILPIVMIDQKPINGGTVGGITKSLMKDLNLYEEKYLNIK